MKKLFFLLIILFPFIANAATHNVTCSGDITSQLTAAHSMASSGDTILVGAGSCTITSLFSISKGITLQGAGIGNTVLTTSVIPFINYQAATPAANSPFRVTGFSFNGNNIVSASYGIKLNNGYSTTPQTNIRIDNNRFYNFLATAISSSGVMGVIDNNTFEVGGQKIPIRFSECTNNRAGGYYYESYPDLIYGADENTMWIEDNTFTLAENDKQLIDSQCGNRYSLRYNSITFASGSTQMPMLDYHGNYDSYYGSYHPYSVFGGEVYGNQVTMSGNNTGYLISVRGGKVLAFNNNVTSTGSWGVGKLREEDPDSACPITANPTWEQHAHDTYQWNNRRNLTTAMTDLYTADECCVDCQGISTCTLHEDCCYNGAGVSGIQHNKQFWNYTSGYDGTSGMGCGTLANRPATCTTGTAYWATTQSCSDLTNMVGVNPTTPISGTLYICGSNNWVDATTYTPLAYPHPLRGGYTGDTTAPTINAWFPTVEQGCDDLDDTEDIAIGLSTNENSTCKWDTSVDGTPTYAELTNTFAGSGGTTHTATATALACNGTRTIYYACQDTAENTTDVASWSFSIAAREDTTTPVITSITSAKQAVALTQKLSITTQIGASCRYCTDGVGGCSSATAWGDRTAFSVTGGSTTHHEVAITQAASTSATYNILCQNTQATATSTNSAITITTDAAKAITATGSLSITQGSGSLSVTILP